jgi:hypothetical protein
MSDLYEGVQRREWFMRDRRDAVHRVEGPEQAWAELADYTERYGEGGAVLYRDVTIGPLIEAEEKP